MIVGAIALLVVAGLILLADYIDNRREQWENEIEQRRRG